MLTLAALKNSPYEFLLSLIFSDKSCRPWSNGSALAEPKPIQPFPVLSFFGIPMIDMSNVAA